MADTSVDGLRSWALEKKRKNMEAAVGDAPAVAATPAPAPASGMSQADFSYGSSKKPMTAAQRQQLADLLKKRSNSPD
jgi:hypothetical protein